MTRIFTIILTTSLIAYPALYASAQEQEWKSDFSLENLTLEPTGKNSYWGLRPGRYVVLGSISPTNDEFVVISVLDETEVVDGIRTRVIEEREYENGNLKEISRNFFATAKETGDVFYFGEDVDDYVDGALAGHSGQWRAGKDGAVAGLYMPANPIVGMRYYMEHHPGVAMDRAEIFEADATVNTPAGTFDGALIVTESSPLEAGDESYKRYAPKIGMIYDDGLELYQYGRKFPSEKYIEFEIAESQLPATPARIIRELHPTGVIREVKVELRRESAFYAVETFIDGKQWDVEVTNSGEVRRNTPD